MSDPEPIEPCLETSDSPLDHVVDDLSGREQAADWIAAEFADGRAAESIIGELVAEGWAGDEANDLVERVRRVTRRQRGVITREEVVEDANRRHHRATGGWFAGLPTFAAAFRLLNALVTLKAFRRFKAVHEESDIASPPTDDHSK